MATDQELKTGDIVGHKFRKKALYLVIKNTPFHYNLIRVKKQAGYPIASKGRYLATEPEKLTIVAHHTPYDNITREDCNRSNFTLQASFQAATPEDLVRMPDVLAEFDVIECNLSPENLCCDGEISVTQVRRRRISLEKQWANLEKRIQLKVSNSVFWAAWKLANPQGNTTYQDQIV